MDTRTPVVLSIAGSDSGGGAGIQADLKAFWDHGFVGATAITAVTAQHTRGVTRVDPVPPEGLRAQIDAVLSDMQVGAIKVGMLGSAAHVAVVVQALDAWSVRCPVVLDPVMVSTSGHTLLAPDAIDVLRSGLVPRCTVCTPNLPELRLLVGLGPQVARADAEAAVARLGTVLVTGGDEDTSDVVDALLGPVTRRWHHPRIAGGPFHGTG